MPGDRGRDSINFHRPIPVNSFAAACIGSAFFGALGTGSGAAAHAHAMRIGLEWMLVPLVAGFLVSVWMVWRRERATRIARSV